MLEWHSRVIMRCRQRTRPCGKGKQGSRRRCSSFSSSMQTNLLWLSTGANGRHNHPWTIWDVILLRTINTSTCYPDTLQSTSGGFAFKPRALVWRWRLFWEWKYATTIGLHWLSWCTVVFNNFPRWYLWIGALSKGTSLIICKIYVFDNCFYVNAKCSEPVNMWIILGRYLEEVNGSSWDPS